MKTLFFIALMVTASAAAQQQTGASVGIPVPASPAAKSAPASDTDAAPETHSFRIRVLDGTTGTPVAGDHVKLWYDEPSGDGYIISTNARGIALMPAPVGQPIRILLRSENAVDCRRTRKYDPPLGYNLADIAAKGMAADNTCGNLKVHTSPGELVLFVRQQRWYEKLNQNPQVNVP